MERAANEAPPSAWSISNNKSHRQAPVKTRESAYNQQDEHPSRVLVLWIHHSEGESVVFVCDELANQRLIADCWLVANIFDANRANFLVALGPAVS